MGNICWQQPWQYDKQIIKKVKIISISTDANSERDSKKNLSHQVLKLQFHQNENNLEPQKKILNQLQIESELGSGGQAKVFKGLLKKHSCSPNSSQSQLLVEEVAIKRMNLQKQSKHLQSLLLAKKIMSEADCPFLMKGKFFIQQENYLYQGMKIAKGGDLSSFLQKQSQKGDAFRMLGEQGIRMVLAGIILGLEYIHRHKLIYCDLKVDNVLIDELGYPLLSDFDLISNKECIPVSDFQGTIIALGPQIYGQQAIDKGIDLWALGVLIYALVYNKFPHSIESIRDSSYINQCQEKENHYCYELNRRHISKQLSELINSLLKMNPKQRLGYSEIAQIKNHKFFDNFDWIAYSKRELQSPLKNIVQEHPIKQKRKKHRRFDARLEQLFRKIISNPQILNVKNQENSLAVQQNLEKAQ